MELANKRIAYDVTHEFGEFIIQGEAIYSMTNEFTRFNGNVNDGQGVTIGSVFYNVEDEDNNISVQFNVKGDLMNALIDVTSSLIDELKNIEV